MAEGLGEVVLGIRVDQAQAEAGLERFRQSAIKAATDATQALNRVGGGGATVTPKIDLSAIDDYARRLAALESSVKAPSIDLSAIKDAIAEALELRRKLEEVDGLKARATAEVTVSGVDAGAVSSSLQSIQQALQSIGGVDLSLTINSDQFRKAAQDASALDEAIKDVDISKVRQELEELSSKQLTVKVNDDEFVQLGQRIVKEEQRLQRLENEQTRIKVQYLVEGLNDGQVTQSIQNLRQALQGLGTVQASVDVNSDDFVRITQEIARIQQDVDRVDGRKAVITADFLIRGLNDGTITQSISNVRKALEGLNSAQVVVDVDSSDFTALGQAIVREEQRLQQLQTRQTVVRVQYLIEGLNNGSVAQSVENIRQALQGLGQVQANLDVDSSDFVRATEDVTRLERRLADIDGRRAQISASFTVRGLDDGSITQSIGNVRAALQSLSNAQVAVRVDSQAFDELGGKIVREEQRLQRLENQQTEVRVKYLVQGLNDGQVTASLRNIQGLIQTLDNQRTTLDITSPNLPTVIRQLQEAKQRADALTAKGLQLEVGSFRQGLQSGQITNNTANLERFLGLLREQQRLVPVGSKAFGQLGSEIDKYQRRLSEFSGATGGAAGSIGTLKSAFLGLGAAFGVVSVVDIGRRIAEAGLNAETAAVRLRALTRAYGETSQAQTVAANAARSLGISQTEAENGISGLFAALRPTGVGLKDIETIFLSFNAAARNSGSTAQEASNAFLQLKQSLSKGFLNGDELRSIGEQAPIVAQAIAQTLGVSVGKLRDLGAQGKITSDVILQSLERIKGTQLAQLGEQLDTGRQRIKDFQIAAEELGKDLASFFAPIGSEFLALATDLTKSLAAINADPAKERIAGVEAEVKRLQEVIELQKKLNLDTTDAKKQLAELETRLGTLNLENVNVQIANEAYERRLKLVKQINEEEDRSRFGGKTQKVTIQTAVSGIAPDPTGLFGQAFANIFRVLPDSPFKDLFGLKDFSTRALEEGAKRVEEAFRKLASGGSLAGFSDDVKAGAEQIQNLEAQIRELTEKKVELPIEAKADQEELNRQIKELENKLAQARLRVRLQIELDATNESLSKVETALEKDPKNPKLIREFNELTAANLRYRAAIQDSNNQSAVQQDVAAELGEAFQKLATDLTAAEVKLKELSEKSIKGISIDPAEFEKIARQYDELKQKLTEELGRTGISRIPEQLAQDLKALEATQPKLQVDSTAFQLVTERIALVREQIAGIEGRKALITAEFILRGLDDGTITTSINRVRTALDQLNTAQANVSVDSTAFVSVTAQIVQLQARINEIDGRKAQITAELIQRGLNNGTIANTLTNVRAALEQLNTAQANVSVDSTDFVTLGQRIVAEEQRLQRFEQRQTIVRVTALVEGIDEGRFANSIANIQSSVQLLDGLRATVDVDSPNLPAVLARLAEVRQRLDQLNGKSAQVEILEIYKGVTSGTLAPSIGNVERLLELYRQQQRQVAIGSDEFKRIGGEIAKLSEVQASATDSTRQAGAQAGQAISSGFDDAASSVQNYNAQLQAAGQSLNALTGAKVNIFDPKTLQDFEGRLAALRQVQTSLQVDSSDFQAISAEIARVSQQQQQASGQLQSAGSTAGDNLAAGGKRAGDAIKDATDQAAKSLRSAQEGAFKFLTSSRQADVLRDARRSIQEGADRGDISLRAAARARTPEQILELANASRSLKEAAEQLKTASQSQPSKAGGGVSQSGNALSVVDDLLKQLQARQKPEPQPTPARQAPTPPPPSKAALADVFPAISGAIEKSAPKLTTAIENGIAVIRQIAPEQDRSAVEGIPTAIKAGFEQSVPTLQTAIENGVATIRQLAPAAGVEGGAGGQQGLEQVLAGLEAFTASFTSSLTTFDESFRSVGSLLDQTFTTAAERITQALTPVVASASELNQGLSSTATAVQALARKDWTVRVNVNAANGAATVSTLNNLA